METMIGESIKEMILLGIIIVVTGIVLLFVGRNVAGSLPPDYQEEDDGFLQLLQSMGRLVSGAGFVFLIVGMVCILLTGVTYVLR